MKVIDRAELQRRFWSKVQPDRFGCLIWHGARTPDGYGKIRNGRSTVLAHRLSWEWARGPIPEDVVIDHLCRNRACVKTVHMELVSRRENTLRGNSVASQRARLTHCKYGHPFSPSNTYYHPVRGTRGCRACNAQAARRYYAAKVQPQ